MGMQGNATSGTTVSEEMFGVGSQLTNLYDSLKQPGAKCSQQPVLFNTTTKQPYVFFKPKTAILKQYSKIIIIFNNNSSSN